MAGSRQFSLQVPCFCFVHERQMESQPVRGSEDIISLEVQSYIRDLECSEILPLEREPNNTQDRYAVEHPEQVCCCYKKPAVLLECPI